MTKRFYSVIGALLTMLCLPMSLMAQSADPAEKALAPDPVAEAFSVQPQIGEMLMQLSDGGTLKAESTAAASQAKVRKAPKKAITKIADLKGTYVMTYKTLVSSAADGGNCITIEPVEGTDSIAIHNFYNSGVTLKAHVDLATKTLTIPNQVLGTVETYGEYDFAFCTSAGKPDRKTQVVGTINDDGTLSITSWWGLFVVSGSYKDRYFGAYYSTEFEQTNATMGYKRYNSTTKTFVEGSYGVIFTQDATNVVTVKNFGNYGKTVEIILKRDSTGSIASQAALANGNGTGYTCAPVYNDSYTFSTYTTTITCDTAATARKISWGDWTILMSYTDASGVQRKAFYGAYTAGWVETNTDIQYPNYKMTVWEGTGTEADPYQIKTLEDIITLSEKVNAAEKNFKINASMSIAKTYQGKYFKVMNDIDMSTCRINPIGYDFYHRFDGTFDGAGHTLKGLKVSTGADGHAGLFGRADTLSVIKNINMTNPSVASEGYYTATIAGFSAGTIDNCHVTGGSVYSGSLPTAGGIAGIGVIVSNCSVSKMTITALGGYGGGIVGRVDSKLENCHVKNVKINAGGVSDTYPSGGVTAELFGATATNCSFAGNIDGTYHNNLIIGGVVGYVYRGGVVDQCFASGSISGYYSSAYVGGIAGYLNGTITNSYSTCNVSAASSRKTGGIAGFVSDYTDSSTGKVYRTTVKNSYSAGTVVAETYLYNKETERREVFGTINEGTTPTVENVYYDTQMEDFKSTEYRSNSTELTAAAGPKGFDASVWTFTEGYYPRLKATADTEAAKWSASLPLLNINNNLDKVTKNVALKLLGNTTACYAVDGKAVQKGNFSSIVGDSVVIGTEFGKDTLFITNPDVGTRYYFLNIAPVPYEGGGMEDNPFLIKTKQDLIKLSEYTTVNKQLFPDTYFKIMNDIDMELDTLFLGISSDAADAHNQFAGHIDGDGHTIHRLTIGHGGIVWTVKPEDSADGYGTPNNASNSQNSYIGFVGRMGADGSLKNLTIAADSKFEFWATSAALVGYNYGTVENCKNYADVKTYSCWVGGIVGQNNSGGVIRNCYNAGKVETGYYSAGGIAGNNAGLIENCQNTGDIYGIYLSKFSKKTNLHTVGGISGGNMYGRVQNCVNSGNIYGNARVGGIVGNNPSSTSTSDLYDYHAEVANCVNYGQLFSHTDKKTVGAIIGKNESTGEIKGNYYDKQTCIWKAVMNADNDGVTGVTTATLTSGKAIDGLSADVWDFKAGQYPVLKQFADESRVKTLRSIIISAADDETAADLHKDVTLGTMDGLTWKLNQGTVFKIEGNTLKSPAVAQTIVTDTLVATVGDVVKPIVIQSLPVIPVTGEGTQASPYLISNATEWNALAAYVANCANNLEGQYVAVTADIDFNGGAITPFSYDDITLLNAADFDGRGHTVKNFKFTPSASYQGAGFMSIGADCHVHDLTFEGTVTSTLTYTAGVVGKLYGKLTNVVNKSSVTNTKSGTAGVIASAQRGARVINVVNEGSVSSSNNYTAGFASLSADSVYYENCYNKGTVTSTYSSTTSNSFTAGFISKAYPDTLINCHNEGQIKASAAPLVVGFIADAELATTSNPSVFYIKNCYNTADITASYSVAGLMGMYSTSGTKVVMDSCYNTGNITSNYTKAKSGSYTAGLCLFYSKGSTYTNCWNSGKVTAAKVACAGGVFAYNKGTITAEADRTLIRNCYNTGDVTVDNYGAGGVSCFFTNYTTVDSCWNSGTIKATNYHAGGLFGFMSGATSVISNCWNIGSVYGDNRIGGIGGQIASGTTEVVNCFNVGDVTQVEATTSAKSVGGVGGIAGYGGCRFTNVYSYGKISGVGNVGGIIGYPMKGTKNATTGVISGTIINNVYFGGTISAPADTCGMILAKTNSTKTWTEYNSVTNAYYVDTCKVETCNSYGEAKTVKDFIGFNMGEGWKSDEAYCMPTIATNSDNDYARIYSLALITADKDTYPTVTTDFFVGAPEGVAWTPSVASVTVSGNNVHFTEPYTGELKLTAKSGDVEKTFIVNCKVESTGIDNAQSGKTVVSERYYTTGGVEISKPQAAAGKQIYIVVRQYSDNTRESVREVR